MHYTLYVHLYYICFPIYRDLIRDLVQYWYNPTSLESASHQTYPKHFTNVNHRHPQPFLREWASCCTSFSRSKLSLKCFSSSFHMSHTQEKHSSVYVSVWHVTCQPKNTDPTVHRLKLASMLSLEIGDWWYVYKSQCTKDCSKPLLLFLEHFFLSGRFFLHLLHSAGHTSICFSMPRFLDLSPWW